jgi:hypothetical protein
VNRTILLAIGGLALGLALSTIGALLLGAARAVAKHVGSTNNRLRADLGQYAAALLALIGFLLTAGAGAVLTYELAPLSGPTSTITAAGAGFLLFAATGMIFSRVADTAEEGKTRRLPAPVYPPGQTPEPVAPVAGSEPAPSTKPNTTRRTGGRHARADAQEAEAAAAGGASIRDAETLLRVVRPGWIYRDQADRWYLGVVDEHTGALPLLRLPDFSLVAVAEPTYPLTVAGAGEIAVVPLPAVPASTEPDTVE